jgi:hypothetical protein
MAVIQQKDTTFTKLFVGGLPYHTTDQSLKDYFQQFGDIEEAVVITDRQTGKSRGYGFVTMADRSAAERICKDPNPIIDGRKANVNLAYLGAKPRIQAADLLAALPFGLKTAAATFALPSCFGTPSVAGLPQYIYPTGFLSSHGLAGYPTMTSAMPGSTTHIPYIDLTTASVAANQVGYPAAQFTPAGFESAAYTTYPSTAGYFSPANGYISPAAAYQTVEAAYPATIAHATLGQYGTTAQYQ